jgi:hypothetical protein
MINAVSALIKSKSSSLRAQKSPSDSTIIQSNSVYTNTPSYFSRIHFDITTLCRLCLDLLDGPPSVRVFHQLCFSNLCILLCVLHFLFSSPNAVRYLTPFMPLQQSVISSLSCLCSRPLSHTSARTAVRYLTPLMLIWLSVISLLSCPPRQASLSRPLMPSQQSVISLLSCTIPVRYLTPLMPHRSPLSDPSYASTTVRYLTPLMPPQ